MPEPRRPVRGLLAVVPLLAVLALGACASETTPDAAPSPATTSNTSPEAIGGEAACVAAITYRQTLYIQVTAGDVARGEALEGAQIPPCNDTGTSESAAEPVEAFAVEGVDPTYAVMTESTGGRFVYVAHEYAPGLVDAKPLPDDVADVLGAR